MLVADTYNGAIRRYADGQVSTVATDLAEPSDVLLDPDGTVVVVESAAHRLVRLAPGVGTRPTGRRFNTERPPTLLAPGPVRLDVLFSPPPGEKLDDSFGSPIRLEVTASPPELLRAGAGVTNDLSRDLVLAGGVPAGVLQVTAQAATCDADDEHAACHLTRQDWGVPVRVTPDGASELQLMLAHRQ